MQDIFWWKHHLGNSLIRQDCYRHSGNQENGTRKLTNLGESKYIVNLGHQNIPV
jgi:hypothetical protein